MATFKAVVDHRKADGTYCIKIRITHNRKSLYVPTQLYVTDKHLTKSKEIKDHGYIIAANRIIDEMRSRILTLQGVENMTAEQLRKAITSDSKTFRLDFIKYTEQKMAKMKPSTAETYLTALNHLKAFRKEIDVNDITYRFIMSFKEHLEDKGVISNTVSAYLSKIKHILNLAKDEYNDDNIVNVRVNPFKNGVIAPLKATAHRTLSAVQIRSISRIEGDCYENFGRDIFILSFCLIGINLIDLYSMKKTNVKNGLLTYCRTKTRDRRQDEAKITIRIEPEAETLMNRYIDNEGEYLFVFRKRYSSLDCMQQMNNEYLKRLRNYDPSLPAELTYYYARHSWATIAYNDCGIDMQTIHEALNHASDANMKITDVYVKKDFSRIWEANRKVLDYVFGSDNE